MKKYVRLFAALVAAAASVAASVSAFSAETYYVSDGYRYRPVSDTEIALSGWVRNDAELTVPAQIDERTVVSVDRLSFRGNTDITTVDFSNASSLTAIESNAFENCSSLETLILPSTITYIGEMAFQNCGALVNLQLDASVSVIDSQVFCDCDSLREVTIPSTVTEIRKYAFGYCDVLESVTIPESVTSIRPSSFYNCPNLVLRVYEGSYAQSYAEENSIPYVLITPYLLGDANNDTLVNINDVTRVQRHLATLEQLEGIALLAGDANQNGDIDIDDATLLQRYLSEYQTDYPIGTVISQ